MIIEEKKVKLSRFIGNKAFYRKLFAVMSLILIQNVITNFVSLLDNVMVGQVGTEPMSGVAIVNQALFVFNLCIFGGLAARASSPRSFTARTTTRASETRCAPNITSPSAQSRCSCSCLSSSART